LPIPILVIMKAKEGKVLAKKRFIAHIIRIVTLLNSKNIRHNVRANLQKH
jgi:hypothetical protein